MFSSKNGAARPLVNGAEIGMGQMNVIAEGTVVEGTVKAAGDVRVSGRLVGKLFTDGNVIVTEEGVVDGSVSAGNAEVAGSVVGEVAVKERLVLRSTAAVDGNVRASRLVVEDGAVFGGKCQMGQANAALKSGDSAAVEAVEVTANEPAPQVPAHA